MKSPSKLLVAVPFLTLSALGLTAPAAAADFTTSTKVFSKPAYNTNDPLTYTIVATNTGAAVVAPNTVTVTDSMPGCVGVPFGWNAGNNVTVVPGPGVVTYVAATRVLTVKFTGFAAGASQTITVGGLSAAGSTPPAPCCNQGQISDDSAGTKWATDDPSTAAPSDATCVSITLPTGPPDFSTSTKDVPLAQRAPEVGLDPVVYTITVKNTGGDAVNTVTLDDVFPDCLDTSTLVTSDFAVNPAPMSKVWTPATRTLTLTWATFPTITNATVKVGSIPGHHITAKTAGQCCNQATVTYNSAPAVSWMTSDPGPPPAGPTCVVAKLAAGPSFTVRTKDVDKPTPQVGTPVKYTLVFTNGGTGAASAAIMRDVIPLCLDVPATWAGGSPGGDVTVSPDAAAVVSYTAATRLLQIDFTAAAFAAAPAAGSTQTVTVNGLMPNTAGTQCCNTGNIAATGLPPEDTNASCLTASTTSVTADLLRNDSVASLAAPGLASIFMGPVVGCGDGTESLLVTSGTAPACPATAGESALKGNGSGDGDDLYGQNFTSNNVDPEPTTPPVMLNDTARPLIFWQISHIPTANTLMLVKDPAPPAAPTNVRFYYQ